LSISSDAGVVDSRVPHVGQKRAPEGTPVSPHDEQVSIEARIGGLRGRAEPDELETIARADLPEADRTWLSTVLSLR
jgi:hypothetical protein